MSFKILINRYRFYNSWYNNLTDVERSLFIGRWIHGRLIIFSGLIKEMERSVAIWLRPTGNYKGKL